MPKGERILSVTLADCDVQTFRAGGNGGQNQNKRDTGVRIIHRASGAVAESREERSQLQNKKKAFRKMAETSKFQAWLRIATGRAAVAEDQVRRDMAPQNLRIEGRETGTWEVIE